MFGILVSELWNTTVYFSSEPDITEGWLEAKEVWKWQETASKQDNLLFSSYYVAERVDYKRPNPRKEVDDNKYNENDKK